MISTAEIEWAKTSWNPLIGCTKYSEGCRNCYAFAMAVRFQKQGVKNYENGFNLTLLPDRLNKPLTWKKPKKIFVNSMSDLFHKDVAPEYLHKIFDVMKKADHHLFYILTKRSQRMLELSAELDWPENIIAGVTIESDLYRYRLDDLKQVPAKKKFLSIEPLIGEIKRLDLKGIDWVVAGGESGPEARPMNEDWVRSIRDWCKQDNVCFSFKQHSDYGGKKSPLLDGKMYREEPDFILKQKDLFSFL